MSGSEELSYVCTGVVAFSKPERKSTRTWERGEGGATSSQLMFVKRAWLESVPGCSRGVQIRWPRPLGRSFERGEGCKGCDSINCTRSRGRNLPRTKALTRPSQAKVGLDSYVRQTNQLDLDNVIIRYPAHEGAGRKLRHSGRSRTRVTPSRSQPPPQSQF